MAPRTDSSASRFCGGTGAVIGEIWASGWAMGASTHVFAWIAVHTFHRLGTSLCSFSTRRGEIRTCVRMLSTGRHRCKAAKRDGGTAAVPLALLVGQLDRAVGDAVELVVRAVGLGGLGRLLELVGDLD